MSISLAVIGNSYSIVASDSRVTNIQTNTYRENAKKLFMTEFGWIANSGGVNFSTKVFQNLLSNEKIKCRKDLYKCWLYSIKAVEDESKKYLDSKAVKKITAQNTGAQAVCSLNYFYNSKAFMNIETIDFAYKMRKLNKINSLVANPPKTTKRIKRTIKKCSELMERTSGLYESVYLIACCINEISKYTNWINNTVDIGISLQISETEILLMDIHENTKEIKKLYKENQDLSEIMKVRRIIHA